MQVPRVSCIALYIAVLAIFGFCGEVNLETVAFSPIKANELFSSSYCCGIFHFLFYLYFYFESIRQYSCLDSLCISHIII